MPSIINALTASGGGVAITGDATGNLALQTAGNTAVTIDTSQNVGIGTSSPLQKLNVSGAGNTRIRIDTTDANPCQLQLVTAHASPNTNNWSIEAGGGGTQNLRFTNNLVGEAMRITSAGDAVVGKTAIDIATAGAELRASGAALFTVSGGNCMAINRLVNDGNLVEFFQATVLEGNISVAGTTVSYNGGHLSRWAQTVGAKDESLVKGTVLSNLDEMNEYVDAEGNLVANEQLNKVKVSDVEGDVNVAGVFVNWSYDEAHNVDEINMAMTGDMIIRIAEGVVVQKGDLLMSAGDGTAKPQGDDIVRSKTIAKVTSNHVTCTYEDGSYCVPCVLMAC